MINPVLIPLPHSDDMDQIYPTSIVEATSYIPATKTAGACHKAKAPRAKGKEKENAGYSNAKKCSQEDRDEDNNYTSLDIKSLLNIVKDKLPLSQHGWQTVQVKFCQWAKLVKTTKPTGDGTCNLNDMDYEAMQDDDSLSVISNQYQDEPTSPPIHHTAIARSTHAEALAPPCNTQGAAAIDLLTQLSTAFDLATQRNRNKDHANCSLATTHLLTQTHSSVIPKLPQKPCMANSLICALAYTTSNHVLMPKCKNLHQEWYPDGGGSTRWLTDEGESTTSEGCKPLHLQKINPSGCLKYSDHPYFKDITNEPIKPIQKEGVQMYNVKCSHPRLSVITLTPTDPAQDPAQGMFQLREINQVVQPKTDFNEVAASFLVGGVKWHV
ncbi:hypothetical protein BDR06DRAFT_1027266 [Suillus hirtellus]|nr:hypothetical protein BDR06DRAFT_1027266 [Suillus hirtellus]